MNYLLKNIETTIQRKFKKGILSIIPVLLSASLLASCTTRDNHDVGSSNDSLFPEYDRYGLVTEVGSRVVLAAAYTSMDLLEIDTNWNVRRIACPQTIDKIRDLYSFRNDILIPSQGKLLAFDGVRWREVFSTNSVTGHTGDAMVRDVREINGSLYVCVTTFHEEHLRRHYLISVKDWMSTPEVIYEWNGHFALISVYQGKPILIEERLNFIAQFTGDEVTILHPVISPSPISYNYKLNGIGPRIGRVFEVGNWIVLDSPMTEYPLPEFVWITNDLNSLCEVTFAEGKFTHVFDSSDESNFVALTHETNLLGQYVQRFYGINECQADLVSERKSYDRGIVVKFQLGEKTYLHAGGSIYLYKDGGLSIAAKLPKQIQPTGHCVVEAQTDESLRRLAGGKHN